jgi:hypothetical protein
MIKEKKAFDIQALSPKLRNPSSVTPSKSSVFNSRRNEARDFVKAMNTE